MREAQAYLTKKFREGGLSGDLEGAKITLNEYLDRWIEVEQINLPLSAEMVPPFTNPLAVAENAGFAAPEGRD